MGSFSEQLTMIDKMAETVVLSGKNNLAAVWLFCVENIRSGHHFWALLIARALAHFQSIFLNSNSEISHTEGQ
jgi:hypothetical protein